MNILGILFIFATMVIMLDSLVRVVVVATGDKRPRIFVFWWKHHYRKENR